MHGSLQDARIRLTDSKGLLLPGLFPRTHDRLQAASTSRAADRSVRSEGRSA